MAVQSGNSTALDHLARVELLAYHLADRGSLEVMHSIIVTSAVNKRELDALSGRGHMPIKVPKDH
jgi:hypothetical protein